MKSMKLGAAFLAAALAFIGTISLADTPQPTQTADWFTAGFNGEDTKWTVPADAAAFENDTLVLDTDGDEEVVYTPGVIQKDTNKITVKTTVKMEPCIGLPDVPDPEDTKKTSFALVKVDETLAYYALTKVDTTVAWVKLAGAVPVEGAVVTVTADFDYSGAGTVTYAVGNAVLYKDGDSTATALPLLSATKASSFSYAGSGTVFLLGGDYRDADRQFAVANAQGGYDYFATEADAQKAVGEGGAYLAFNSTGGVWDEKTAPLFVAEVFNAGGESKGKAASLTAAVGLAAAGDVIKVIRDVANENVTVDKSVTITSGLEAKPTLNNVKITESGAAVNLTVSELSFVGDSYINANNAKGLFVTNVVADVTPTKIVNGRSSFIVLSASEVESGLDVEVVGSTIFASKGDNAAGDAYATPIFGWGFLNKVTVCGNQFGDSERPYKYIGVKFMNVVDGAEFVISDNDVYGSDVGYGFFAFDLYQNNSRLNTYVVKATDNRLHVPEKTADVYMYRIECNTLYEQNGHCILLDQGSTVNDIQITLDDFLEEYNNGNTEVIRGQTLRAAILYGVGAVLDANGKLIAGVVSDNVPSLFGPDYEAVAQGTDPETWVVQEKAEPVTICVSSEGGDDDGDGTAEKPLATLAKAVATANSGDTVKLLTDLTGNFALDEAKDLSFDLGDKTLTGSVTVSAGSLVLSGAGTITGTVTGATVADGFLMSKYQQAKPEGGERAYTAQVYRILPEDDVAVRLTDTTADVYYFRNLGEASCSFVRDGAPYKGEITIAMLKSNHGGGLRFVQKDATITVDFSGFTYTVDSDQLAGSAGTTTQAAQILKRITMTFKNGTLIANHPQIKDMIRSYAANMTFDNMVIDGTKMTDPRMTVVCLNGEMHLKNGTKVLAAANTPALTASYYVINATEYKSGLLYIDDNDVEIDGSLTYQRDDGITIATMLETVKHIKPADYLSELVIPDECEWVDYTDGKKFLDYKKVAQITVSDVTTKYYTLEDAVAAAGEDDVTIVVIADTDKLTAPTGWEFKTDSETGITTLIKTASAVASVYTLEKFAGVMPVTVPLKKAVSGAFLDMDFWELVGCLDADGNKCPQYVEITDKTLYRDTYYEDESASEAWVSANYLFENYLAAGKPYEDYQGDYMYSDVSAGEKDYSSLEAAMSSILRPGSSIKLKSNTDENAELSYCIPFDRGSFTCGELVTPNGFAVYTCENGVVVALHDEESWEYPGHYDVSWYTENQDASEYEISTAAQLAGLAVLANGSLFNANGEAVFPGGLDFAGKTITLTDDIDLSDYRWIPISGSAVMFAGTFNGNGKRICGMTVDGASDSVKGGLFNAIGSGRVCDIWFCDCHVSGSNVGMLADTTETGSVLEGVVVKADCSATATSYASGIVSTMACGDIYNCWNYATVTSDYIASGIVGYIQGSGSDCSQMTNCVNNGAITGANRAGGIAAHANYADVSWCYNTGTVSHTAKKTNMPAGGIVAVASFESTITYCLNTGAVSACGTDANATAGGILGHASNPVTTRFCDNCGDITANGQCASGIAPSLYGTTTEYCRNGGTVTSVGSNAGGIAADPLASSSTTKNCVCDGALSGLNTWTFSKGNTGGYYYEGDQLKTASGAEATAAEAVQALNDAAAAEIDFWIVGDDGRVHTILTVPPDPQEPAAYVAEVISADGTTTNKYSTWQEACAGMKKNSTLKLLADIDLDETAVIYNADSSWNMFGMVVDGGGHTITIVKDGVTALKLGDNQTADREAYDVAVKDLTIVTADGIVARDGINQRGGQVTPMSNVNVSGAYSGYAVRFWGCGGAVLDNSHFANTHNGGTANEFGCAVWSSVAYQYPIYLTNGSTISGIGINTYGQANPLYPRIFADSSSSIGEIVTYEDKAFAKTYLISTDGDAMLQVGKFYRIGENDAKVEVPTFVATIPLSYDVRWDYPQDPANPTIHMTAKMAFDTLEGATEAAGDDDVITVVGDHTQMTAPTGWEFKTDSETGITTLVKTAAAVCQIGTTKYPTLAAALLAAKSGDKVVLIGAATGEATVPADKALTLDATDAGSFAGSIAVADTASLAIRGGKYNLSALTGAVTLYGGIYATAPEAAFVATGYEVANNPDTETATAYPKKVQEPTVTTDDDEPIVIDIDPTAHEGQGESVPVVVTQDLAKEILGVEVTTLTEEQKVAVTNALQTAGEDGMTGWQKYAAGFKQTDKHPLAPKGRGGEDGKLVLVTSLVAPKQLSVDTGVKVKYILMKGSNVSPTTGLPQTWTKEQELPTPEFPVDVTKLANETYWKIEVEYTATKKVVETEVDPAE